MNTKKHTTAETETQNHEPVEGGGAFTMPAKDENASQLYNFLQRLAKHVEEMKENLLEKEDNISADQVKDTLYQIWKLERDILIQKKMTNFTSLDPEKGLGDPWRDLHWCAKYMGIAHKTIKGMATPAVRAKSDHPFPAYKVRGKVVSKQSLIDEWILKKK